MKIGVGSVVKVKVGDKEGNKRDRRIRRTRKEVMGCVQDFVGMKKLLVQFEDG